MKSYCIKRFISIILIIMIGLHVFAQDNYLKFSVVHPCQNNLSFLNESHGFVYFLWIFNDTIETPAKDPVIYIENFTSGQGFVNVVLIGWNDNDHPVQLDTNILVYSSPEANIISEDLMVCSNAENKSYSVDTCHPEYDYQWSIASDYHKMDNSLSPCQIIVDWGEIHNEFVKDIEISVEIVSDHGCRTSASEHVLLLQNEVPDVNDVQIIRKPSEGTPSNILVCLIDNPEKYTYDWCSQKNDHTDFKSNRTSESYYYYEEGILPDYDYWVEISDNEFSICFSIVEFDKTKDRFYENQSNHEISEKLFLYPNPTTKEVNLIIDNIDCTLVTLYIRDAFGKTVRSFDGPDVVVNNGNSISLRGVPGGLYLIEAILSNGVVLKNKLIVQ